VIVCRRQYYDVILATLHAPSDAVHCLKVPMLGGMSAQIRGIAGQLTGTTGVMHGKPVMTMAWAELL
jgi:metal-responsive CopG/Arc/MetJ family transcriptional regulator